MQAECELNFLVGWSPSDIRANLSSIGAGPATGTIFFCVVVCLQNRGDRARKLILSKPQPNLNLVGFDTIIAVYTTPHHPQELY